MFTKAYRLYSLFWGLNLGLVKVNDFHRESSGNLEFLSEEKKPQVKGSVTVFEKLGELVKKRLIAAGNSSSSCEKH